MGPGTVCHLGEAVLKVDYCKEHVTNIFKVRLLASRPWHLVGVPCMQSFMYTVNFEDAEEGKKNQVLGSREE